MTVKGGTDDSHSGHSEKSIDYEYGSPSFSRREEITESNSQEKSTRQIYFKMR